MRSKFIFFVFNLAIVILISCDSKLKEEKISVQKKKVTFSENQKAFRTRIKSITEYYHAVSYGKVDSIGIKSKYKLYDTFGNKVLEINYSNSKKSKKDEIYSKKEFIYNCKNNLKERIEMDSNNKIVIHEYYFYNDLGLLKELDHQNPIGKGSNNVYYKYNSNNLLSEKTQYDNDGKFQHKEVFEYDSLNNVKKFKKFDSNSRLIKSENYNYDKASNLTKKEEYNFAYRSDREITIYIYTYKYDIEGNLIEECEYLPKYFYAERKTPSFFIKNKYNDNGEKIESEMNNQGIIKFIYDKKSNLIENINYINVQGIVSSEKYYIEYYE